MRYDSIDGHGLNPKNYNQDDLFETIQNCIGSRLNAVEQRLAVVAFEGSPEIAKKCIWYG